MQQPPLLQRRRALARAHQPVQDERLRLAQIPARGADQILPEPAQRAHALVAIHQDELLGPLAVHDHDRHLLADRPPATPTSLRSASGLCVRSFS